MKLDLTSFRYITKDEFRVLTAVEMTMKNHEFAPVQLIETVAKGNRGQIYKLLQSLLRNKLVAHENKMYDGYRLTYHGYDYLAIRALVSRGTVTGVGRRLGVGKESDVHFCQGAEGQMLAIKLHRLGRISFRNIKEKRDYLRHGQHASWMYMARLAAVKEFAYMKALKDEGFPVPVPIDQNRHCVVMSYLEAVPLFRIRALKHPYEVLERLMRLLVRLARAGIIHGDFNEFNLMVHTGDEKVTLIDFPQIVHVSHRNAAEYFDRDAQCVVDFFRKRLNIEVEEWPQFHEVMADYSADGGASLSAALPVEGLDAEADALLLRAHADGVGRRHAGRGGGEGESDSGEEEEEDEDEEDEERLRRGDEEDGAGEPDAAAADRAIERLVPEGGQGALGGEDDVEVAGDDASCGIAAGEDQPGARVGAEEEAAAVAGEDDGGGSDTSGAEEDGTPGQVSIKVAKRRLQRRQVTAKEAQKNLQKQQKQRPAKANNQKSKDLRRAKHEVREYLG